MSSNKNSNALSDQRLAFYGFTREQHDAWLASIHSGSVLNHGRSIEDLRVDASASVCKVKKRKPYYTRVRYK